MISGVTALAIAAAPINTPPAQARNDFESILLGVTALAIIGGIAANENKKRRRRDAARVYRQTPVYEAPRHQRNYDNYSTYNNQQASYGTVRHTHGRYGLHVHHGNLNNHRRVLKEVVITKRGRPARCFRERWNHGEVESYYDYQCVQRYQQTRTVMHYK